MSFFGSLIQKHSQKNLSFSNPIFMKDSNSISMQIEALKRIKSTSTAEQSEKIDKDIKMLYSGLNGEKAVAYELRNSFLPIFILQDLYLKSDNVTAQIDFVIISQNFLLVIECKKLLDDIEITEKGDFNRCFKTPTGLIYKKEGMYNPLTQNQRHIEIIRKTLEDNSIDFNPKKNSEFLQQIIVLANEKTIIRDSQAPEQVKNCIVKCDQLIGYLKNLSNINTATKLSENEMKSIANTLLKSQSENQPDYTKKYGTPIPICPYCKIEMVKRIAQKGANIGKEFYGCPNYPKCRQIINIKIS